MIVRENVALAPLTTFHIGGPARYFIEATSEEEVREALRFASERELPLFVLGAGSNMLVQDGGVDGVVLKIAIDDITESTIADGIQIEVGAGARWDDVVDFAVERNLFGIENLAGVPGSSGGAVVQNIGAYGAELADVFAYAKAVNRTTGKLIRVESNQAEFGYRTSRFKKDRNLIILRLALLLKPHGTLNIAYSDLLKAREANVALATPKEVAKAVRAIRAKKFPHSGEAGTAGSFFKNPVLAKAQADALVRQYPELPAFPQEDGRVKVSLAWLLDHALSLKGLAVDGARLYEKQPLVIVANRGTTARTVEMLAQKVAARVHETTGIVLEREVESVGEDENNS